MRLIAIIVVFLIPILTYSQSEYRMKGNDKAIDVNFLASYYQQEGNNSAVEGGIGTEHLIDGASMLIVNIPIDSAKSLQITVGADAYTSASTDMIDARMSSASVQDTRVYGNLGFTQKDLGKGLTYGGRVGFSNEFDYTSINGGLNFAKEWNQGNTELSFQAQAFIDQWRPYFPIELRRTVTIPTNKRSSYNLSAVFSQVLNKQMQIAISAEAIYMTGLLSTPFHRVYFSDMNTLDIERLPQSRLKIPLSVQFNYFISDRFILRSYYRYYEDDFGIKAHTASLELPIKINNSISISPFFRYHTQEGSIYFAPYKTHLSTEQYYTSDFDLSTLKSKHMGVAFGYYPVYGLAHANLLNRQMSFKSIEFRTAYYMRNTGLNSFIGSVNLQFQF